MFIQQIQVLNIFNMVYILSVFFLSSKCSLFHNSNVFGYCIIHILYTGCAKIKKVIPAPKINKRKTTHFIYFYIFIQQIQVLNILNMLYTLRFFSSSKCSLFHNSNVFGFYIIHILYTGCAKIKKNNSGAKRLINAKLQIGKSDLDCEKTCKERRRSALDCSAI